MEDDPEDSCRLAIQFGAGLLAVAAAFMALAVDTLPGRPVEAGCAPWFTRTTIYARYVHEWRLRRLTVNRDALLETLAAELALAAYRVALRTRTEGTWLDLELDLWRALADTARTWGDGIASVPITSDAACGVQQHSPDGHEREPL